MAVNAFFASSLGVFFGGFDGMMGDVRLGVGVGRWEAGGVLDFFSFLQKVVGGR